MGRSINLPFLPLPDIQLSTKEAYEMMSNGETIRVKLGTLGKRGSDFIFMYVKQHPRRRGKFILSKVKSFKPFELFCIARTEEVFLDRYRDCGIFYLLEQ